MKRVSENEVSEQEIKRCRRAHKRRLRRLSNVSLRCDNER
jgi:hypothetical protein